MTLLGKQAAALCNVARVSQEKAMGEERTTLFVSKCAETQQIV